MINVIIDLFVGIVPFIGGMQNSELCSPYFLIFKFVRRTRRTFQGQPP